MIGPADIIILTTVACLLVMLAVSGALLLVP